MDVFIFRFFRLARLFIQRFLVKTETLKICQHMVRLKKKKLHFAVIHIVMNIFIYTRIEQLIKNITVFVTQLFSGLLRK